MRPIEDDESSYATSDGSDEESNSEEDMHTGEDDNPIQDESEFVLLSGP